jgi:hypothetical protein
MFSCAPVPTNLYDVSNTRITLFAQSYTGIVSASDVEDSTGNIVKIGVQSNLWMNVDSVQFRQVVQTATILKDSIIGVKDSVFILKYSDTVWQSIVFNEMGTKTIKAVAYLNNGHIISDSIRISIYPRFIS